MILGLGIDIVEARRLLAWLERPGLAQRFFAPEELASALSRSGPVAQSEALASRFACKEAFGKALGSGLAGLRLADIQLCGNGRHGPELRLSGQALVKYNELGGRRLWVSLSHDAGMAVATVVIEGGQA